MLCMLYVLRTSWDTWRLNEDRGTNFNFPEVNVDPGVSILFIPTRDLEEEVAMYSTDHIDRVRTTIGKKSRVSMYECLTRSPGFHSTRLRHRKKVSAGETD